MKKDATSNTFSDGLIMDFNPLVAPNNTISNALNATLLTYNGNDNVLQNDMGNVKIPNAELPSGFIPVGTTELGGIIYIASYNPLTHEGQIGSFPSPQKSNIEELSSKRKSELDISKLIALDSGQFSPENPILNNKQLIYLSDNTLHAGDQFRIYINTLNKYISAYGFDKNINKLPKYIKFSVVSVQDNGKIIDLGKSLEWTYKDEDGYFFINVGSTLEILPEQTNNKFNYSVYSSKVSGKLAILVQLECINSFSVSWDAKKNKQNKYEIYLATNWTYDNEEAQNAVNLNSIIYNINSTGNILLKLKYPIYYNNDMAKIDTIAPDAHITGVTYLSPDYESSEPKKYIRKNDYTDSDFIIEQPIYTDTGENKELSIDIYPAMPFGYISIFKRHFDIDLSKLGSGEIILKQYKYIHDDKGIILYWGIDSYPEMNKKIDSIDFNFYKVTPKLYSSIKETYKEQNGTEYLTNSIIGIESREQSFTDIRPSYSGYFSKRITELQNNSLYVVELCIHYTNEDRYLYRLLYNSDIFNNYFDIIDDYHNINLNDIITNNTTYSVPNISYTNQASNNKLYLENTEIYSLPKYLDDTSKTITKQYKVFNKESYDISGEINSSNIWPFINISIESLNFTDNIKYTDSNNAKQIQLAYGGQESNITSLDAITKTVKLSNIKYDKQLTASYAIEVYSPISITYGTKEDVSVDYELTPIVVNTDYWIMVEGQHHIWSIGIYNDYDIANVSPQAKISYKDDIRRSGNIQVYPDLYNFLDSQLDKADVLAIRFRTHDSATDGNQKNISIWAKGTLYTSSTTHGLYNLYYYSGNGKVSDGPNLIMYAIKDSNDTVQLFTYGQLKQSAWYNTNIKQYDETSVQQGFEYKSKWPTGYPLPITLNQKDVTEDVLTAPFKNYHKLISIIDKVQKLRWDNVKYYTDYNYQITCSLAINPNIKVSICGIDIEPNKNIPNLYYNPIQNTTINITFTTKVSPSYYINQLSYIDTSKALVKIPNEDSYEIKELEVSPRNLYIDENTPVYYLKEDEGNSSDFKSLANTQYRINTQNEMLRVTLGAVNKDRYVMAIGREEEQNATIKEIINLGPISNEQHRN